ncbi:MAG TPA: chemotaxis protein CheX [Candidatus Koribacter sp.]|jgi:chemotaxis protein CheX
MSIKQEDLIRMNEQIWTFMLGLPISASEFTEIPSPRGGYLGACVQLVGAWQGAVRLDCTKPLAERAAASLIGKDLQDLCPDEVRDTIGELANMVAGSVKALLPQPTHISLPSVADGNDYDLSVRRGRLLLQCLFTCEAERLLVSLIERDLEAESRIGRPLTHRLQ